MLITWMLLASAVLLWRPARRVRREAALAPSSTVPARRAVRRVPLRALQAITGLAAAALCIAVVGPSRGLLAGCVLAPATIYAVARLDARTDRAPPLRGLALCLDLVAAALRGGQPLSSALVLAAPAAPPEVGAGLTQVARLLRLGADPAEAWRGVADDDVLEPVARAACRSASSGIRLARGMEQVGDDIRARVRAAAQARAQRAGVLAIVPLGCCFLPAFVCLGGVPVVACIADGIFSAVP
jgi:Flp pilus assembly protein TadB